MKSFLLPMLALVVLASSIDPVLCADDAKPAEAKPAEAKKTYQVFLRERWKAGDVATRSVKESSELTSGWSEGSAEPKVLPKSQKLTSYVAILKCLEADSEGYATKFIVYLTAWSVEFGPEKDSCLAGVHIEVSGKGADRAWKTLTPDANLSPVAKNWIELNFGKISAGDATNADLEPPNPVEVGATWDGNALAIAKRVAARGLSVLVEKAQAKGTLLGVDDGQIHVKVSITMPQTDLVYNGQRIPWKEGGVTEMTVDIVRPLEAGMFGAKLHTSQKTVGVAAADNGTITSESELTREIEITPGGKMPAVPAAPADGEKKAPAMEDSPPK